MLEKLFKKIFITSAFLTCLNINSYSQEKTPNDFLNELSKDTYHYLVDAEKVKGKGLPENWRNVNGQTGSYCSPEEAGFYALSHVGAQEMGLLDLNTAKLRIEKTLDTLKTLDTYFQKTGTVWQLGVDEGPPIYDPRAFDEFDTVPPFNPNFNVPTNLESEFPKEINDLTLRNINIDFDLTPTQVNKDLSLYLDTLYASHTSGSLYVPYTTLRVKVNNNNLGNYAFSSQGAYPESRYIPLKKEFLNQGDNRITISMADAPYTGHWLVWDSLSLSEVDDFGLYYRFYYTDNLNSDSNNVPSIGNAMLASSLITIGEWAKNNNLDSLETKCSEIVNKMDLSPFWDSQEKRFYYDLTKTGHWDYYSDEGRLLSFMALAQNNISDEDFRNNLAALNQTTLFYNPFTGNSSSTQTSPQDIKVKRASWDGSMFTYLVPSLFIQEQLTPYLKNTSNPVVESQISYANNSNYNLGGVGVWGISDCLNPSFFYCSEFQGAPPATSSLFAHSPDESCPGLITPHASALALITDFSQEAITNLINLKENSNIYDDNYGFKDSISTQSGEVTPRFLTLDQEWIFLSLMNYQNGTVWGNFYQNPNISHTHNIMYPPLSSQIFNLSNEWYNPSTPNNLIEMLEENK